MFSILLTIVKIKHYYSKIKRFYYLNILKRKYYKKGACNCCGRCCQRIYVKHGKNILKDEKLFERLQLLHRFYTYLDIVGKDESGLIFSCRMLKDNKCSIHYKRPPICRKYPQEELLKMGGSLSEGCGYRLEPIIPFSEILENMMKKS